MFNSRFAVLVLAFGMVASTVRGQEDDGPIRLGNHEVHPTRILAKYKDGAQNFASAPALQAANVAVSRRMRSMPRLVVLEAQGLPSARAATPAARANALAARIQALRDSGQFEYVEPDYTVYASAQPTDVRFADGTLWGLRNLGGAGGIIGADINAEAAWDVTTGSTNVVVAVIDSGVRYTHQDLANQMWRNPGEIPNNGIDDDGNGYVDDVFGINAILNNGDPMDDNDHGTHCAGTIGAQANGGGGHVGVAWNVRIMALKFLGASGFGQTSDAIECLDYAVAMGAKISNNSWGGGPYSEALYDAIVNARANNHLFIAAAGNEANDNDADASYPASYDLDNIISVAAIDRADRLANFSNYGLTSVDLGAPGVAIFSAISTTDSSYASFDGTSMASPHVAGVAALLRAHLPTATYQEIRERILATVVPIPALTSRTVTGGRLNAFNALAAAPDGQLEMSVTPPSGSVILGGSPMPVYVRVTDLIGVTNATVTATVSLGGNITFLNGGAAPDVTASDAIYTGNFDVPDVETNVTLTIVATAPDKLSITNSVEYSIIPPPTNDDFDFAAKVPNAGGLVLGANIFASLEPGEPLHAGVTNVAASVWWNWSAPATGPVLVDTTGSTFDTVLAIYTGNNVAALTQRAAVNDVPNSKAGYVYFNAVAANTYRIVVAGANTNEMGGIRLRVTPNGVPDTNAPTVAVTSHLSGATVQTNRIVFAGTASDPTPNSSGLSQVQVRVNGVVPAITAVGTTNWSASLLLQLGANSVETWAFDNAGNISAPVFRTIYYYPPPPTNDYFVTAIQLTGTNGTVTVADTTLGTKEFNEPNHAGNVGGHSVWWKFTASTNGLLSLSTTNSTFDTLLGVYLGNAVGSLTTVAHNDDSDFGSFSETSLAVQAGQTYRIAVDGYAGAAGMVSLTYAFTPGPVFTVTVNTTGNGTVSPASAVYSSNALVTLVATPADEFVFSQWSGSLVSMANPLTFNIQSDMVLTAAFVPEPHTDGFESGGLTGLNWSTAGDPWIVQSTNVSAGTFAARSGLIPHNGSSSLILTSDFNDGQVSFDLRVSSELAWDALRVFVDGDLINEWSGEIPWQTYAFPIEAGTHTIEWRYSKDGSDVNGLDAAFIDNVDLPLNIAVAATTPAQLRLRRMTDGSFVVDLTGQANQTYIIETSPDLAGWLPLSTNILFGGAASVPDPASVTNAPRYYRAYVPLQ